MAEKPRNSHTFTKKPGSLAKKDARIGYLFIAPQMLGFFLFVLGPLVTVFVFSFQSRNLLSGKISFVGFENYRQMFSADPLFYKTMVNSLIFTAGLVPCGVALALGLALLLHKSMQGMSFFRTVFFAPVVTSAAAWAIVWKFLLQGEAGPINQMLTWVGIEGPNWLRDPMFAMIAVILTRVIKNVGINMILFLAAVTNLPEQLYEAALIDGASKFQAFRKITIPLLMPTIFMVTILMMIGSLKVFDHIMLLTGGGPNNATMVLVYFIYYQAFEFFETGYASCLAVILFLITMSLTAIQWGLRKRIVYSEV